MHLPHMPTCKICSPHILHIVTQSRFRVEHCWHMLPAVSPLPSGTSCWEFIAASAESVRVGILLVQRRSRMLSMSLSSREIRSRMLSMSGTASAGAVSMGSSVNRQHPAESTQPRRRKMDRSGRSDAGGSARNVSLRDAVLAVQPRRGEWTSPSMMQKLSHERSDPLVSEDSRWCGA